MDSWSYSQYSAAVKCLKLYNLTYIQKLDPGVPESGDLTFGSAMHSAINAAIKGEDGAAVFDIYWQSYKHKELTYGRYNWETLNQLGIKFISRFTNKYAFEYKIIKAEERFSAEYKGIKFEGTPDFIGTHAGIPSLSDFKTSGYNYPKGKSRVALQLNLYAYLSIKNLGFTPKELRYVVFNKGAGTIQNMAWDFSEKKMYDDLDNLWEYCELFKSSEATKGIHNFPANPNSCIMGSITCKYFNHCHGELK